MHARVSSLLIAFRGDLARFKRKNTTKTGQRARFRPSHF